MSESTKTLSFIGTAVVLVLLAVFTWPRPLYVAPEGEKGQRLFPDWDENDVSSAASLEIKSFDDVTGKTPTLKIEKVNNRWVLPGQDNYPANAEQQVLEAVKTLIGMKILAVTSDAAGDHEVYGVVEPNENKVEQSSIGVGKLVVVRDAAGKELAQLIIGKEDKSPSSEEGAATNRFVRKAGQPRVYLVSLPTDPFATNFQDWIDTDLLQLKQNWDISNIQFRDYSLDDKLVRKDDVSLAWDEKLSQWTLKNLTEYKSGKPQKGSLPADDEINGVKVNDAKTNLSSMKIRDVFRKPESFIALLKEGKNYLDDKKAATALAEIGIIPMPEKNPTDMFSLGDDMKIGMKDGVEYDIHFGGTTMTRAAKEAESKKPALKGAKAAKATESVRFVLVTARFNPELLPQPMLDLVPAAKTPEKTKPTEPKSPASEPKAQTPATKTPASSDNKKPAASSFAPKARAGQGPIVQVAYALADPPADASKSGAGKTGAGKTDAGKADGAKADAPKSDAAKSDAAKADAAKSAAPKTDAAKPDATKPDATKPDASKPKAPPEEKQPVSATKRAEEEEAEDALRKRIESDNKRKLDQYKDAVKHGTDHAKELNNRFRDWFYLISDDEYKKVHLTWSEIVKKKGANDAEPPPGPPGAFGPRHPPISFPPQQ